MIAHMIVQTTTTSFYKGAYTENAIIMQRVSGDVFVEVGVKRYVGEACKVYAACSCFRVVSMQRAFVHHILL